MIPASPYNKIIFSSFNEAFQAPTKENINNLFDKILPLKRYIIEEFGQFYLYKIETPVSKSFDLNIKKLWTLICCMLNHEKALELNDEFWIYLLDSIMTPYITTFKIKNREFPKTNNFLSGGVIYTYISAPDGYGLVQNDRTIKIEIKEYIERLRLIGELNE